MCNSLPRLSRARLLPFLRHEEREANKQAQTKEQPSNQPATHRNKQNTTTKQAQNQTQQQSAASHNAPITQLTTKEPLNHQTKQLTNWPNNQQTKQNKKKHTQGQHAATRLPPVHTLEGQSSLAWNTPSSTTNGPGRPLFSAVTLPIMPARAVSPACLLYTSDAADE